MTVRAPMVPFSLDPLIAEAKRRMRRRRLLVAAALALGGAATAAAVVAARSPAGGYTSIAWTRGRYVQMRYCRGPDAGPGAFLAASAGVSCRTAETIAGAITTRCYGHSPCAVASFRCAAYWSGRFAQSFEAANHALCSDGSRRVVWDGG